MKALENTVEKGENAGKQHFLVFPVFSILSRREIIILTPNLSSAIAFNLEQFCHLIRGYTVRLEKASILNRKSHGSNHGSARLHHCRLLTVG